MAMGWDQLRAIAQEAREDLENEIYSRPQACPNDGQPLEEDKNGVLRCNFDGWSER